ncbi:MAG: DNA polymerase III subunit delta [Candidatus Omnitrophica bacterium]|nr:DNA polymerase III subunit delta [Candidatus Omnitrophota bacterium]
MIVLNNNPSIYLLTGSEQFLKEEHLARIKARFLEKTSQEFNLNIFYPGSASGEKILECAYNAPLLGKKRVVIVRQVENFSSADRKLMLSYIKAPYQHTILVLETDKKDPGDLFPGEIRKHLRIITCNQLTENQIFPWISAQVKSMGKKIEYKARLLLVNRLGENLELISNALKNIVLFIGQRDTITSQDVEQMVGRNIETDAFELFQAVNDRRKERTFQILDSLLKDGVRPTQILGALAHEILSPRNRINASCRRLFLRALERTDREIKTGLKSQRIALELLMAEMLSLQS